jgi:hypothetical protein
MDTKFSRSRDPTRLNSSRQKAKSLCCHYFVHVTSRWHPSRRWPHSPMLNLHDQERHSTASPEILSAIQYMYIPQLSILSPRGTVVRAEAQRVSSVQIPLHVGRGWRSFGWDRINRGPLSQYVWHEKEPSLL